MNSDHFSMWPKTQKDFNNMIDGMLNQTFTCECCKVEMKVKYKDRHDASKKHIKNLKESKE